MPDLWMDVDAALSEVPVNMLPLLDDTDGKTIETCTYNQAGLALYWNFVTTAGAFTHTQVTPTDTGGNYDWVSQGQGMFTIEIPASGGASINNDTEGFGWFTGSATGILPWRGPIIGFRAAGLNNKLIDDAYSTTRALAGTALPDAAADAAGGLPISDAGALDLDAQIGATGLIQDIDDEVDYIHSVIDSIAVTGSALSKEAASNTLTVGTESSGTYASTAIDNGVYHVITAASNEIDIYYEFQIGASGVPTKVNIAGYLKEGAPAGGDTIDLYAYNWGGSAWELLQTAIFTGITTSGPDVSHTVGLLNRHVGTAANDGKVRIRFQAASLEAGTTLNLDYLVVEYAESIAGDIASILEDTGTTLDTLVKDIPTNAELTTALGTLNDIDVADIFAGVIDGTVDLEEAMKQILAKASGNVAKSGNAYAFKDRAGNTLFTLTIAADSVTRS